METGYCSIDVNLKKSIANVPFHIMVWTILYIESPYKKCLYSLVNRITKIMQIRITTGVKFKTIRKFVNKTEDLGIKFHIDESKFRR